MTILEGVPGLEVSIQSNGQDLPEYNDDSDWSQRKFIYVPVEKRISKYVECVTDAEFRIHIVLTNRYPDLNGHSLTFRASVDGHGIAQATCTPEYFNAYRSYRTHISARLDRISPTQLSSRVLKFSSIKKVDDPDSIRVRNDAKLMSGIGEIVVSVYRTAQVEATPPPPGNFTVSQHAPPSEVSEKALKGKAISHGVAYGQQQIIERTHKETIDLDGPNKPIVVFVFKYRCRKDLQSELIIPRSPSPELEDIVPLSARSRNSGNLPISKEAKLANLKREMEQIKAEDGEDNPQGRKRSRDGEISSSGRAYKTSRSANGTVVVDLTDD